MIEWNEKEWDTCVSPFPMFLHKTNPKVEDYGYEFAIPHLKKISELIKKYNHRVTFHPGQFMELHINAP